MVGVALGWSSLATGLWLLAVAAYGVGDLVTTMVGLRSPDLEEGQAGAQLILGEPPSWWRFSCFKLVFLAVCYAGYVALEGTRARLLVPAGIALVGLYAVFNNVRVMVAVR
ncbi:hypothetical protein D8Y22_12175 [Salinadaptatus halalkaliphilus]|uniref:DUF5658 domain-containing protein n=1 Tax=Salinadaptatus halalkaliphilus TaxID=2419781 RepID=A0A4S3TKF0_9EURY|nr:hypothetical protein D8Y22_12175 [Salinadaptatus halalkaliphilus]